VGMIMGLIESVSFVLLCIFGISYIGKLIILSKENNIKANIFGKGVKNKEILIIEKFLRAMTFAGVGIWTISALFPSFTEKWFVGLYKSFRVSILGLAITLIGVLFFILAMVFMKTSWRVGIDKSTKTSLVTSGLYRFSRNPAFVGMDLMFLGTAITHVNLMTVIVALLVVVGIHLQILQEEKHMKEVFKNEYNEYVNKTPRYLLF
jgi:protein-S-isoprenylcysteine O-methyltransferase Ste14